MRRSGRKLIGQLLVEKGFVTQEQLEQALEAQKQSTQLIGEILIDLGYVQRQAFFETLAEQLRVPFIDLSRATVDSRVALLLEKEIAQRHKALPVGRGDGTIRVAMAEPEDVMAADDLKMRLQVPVEALLADPVELTRTIDKVFKEGGGGGGGAAAGAAAAMPMPMRASFIIWNMQCRPLPGWPTR